jgi:hypothetical protein
MGTPVTQVHNEDGIRVLLNHGLKLGQPTERVTGFHVNHMNRDACAAAEELLYPPSYKQSMITVKIHHHDGDVGFVASLLRQHMHFAGGGKAGRLDRLSNEVGMPPREFSELNCGLQVEVFPLACILFLETFNE